VQSDFKGMAMTADLTSIEAIRSRSITSWRTVDVREGKLSGKTDGLGWKDPCSAGVHIEALGTRRSKSIEHEKER